MGQWGAGSDRPPPPTPLPRVQEMGVDPPLLAAAAGRQGGRAHRRPLGRVALGLPELLCGE
eukprot:313523-Pyramimonas_sp.AAC.1